VDKGQVEDSSKYHEHDRVQILNLNKNKDDIHFKRRSRSGQRAGRAQLQVP
jgi:hypothetical protein